MQKPIQWILASPVQAMMKSPAAKKTDPIIIGGKRASGMTLLPLLSNCVLYLIAPHMMTTEAKRTPIMIAVKGTVETTAFHFRICWNSNKKDGTALTVY